MEALGLEWSEHRRENRCESTGCGVRGRRCAPVTSVDEIIAATGLTVEGVLERLMELEIDGLVGAHGGGYVRLPASSGRTDPMNGTLLRFATSRGDA